MYMHDIFLRRLWCDITSGQCVKENLGFCIGVYVFVHQVLEYISAFLSYNIFCKFYEGVMLFMTDERRWWRCVWEEISPRNRYCEQPQARPGWLKNSWSAGDLQRLVVTPLQCEYALLAVINAAIEMLLLFRNTLCSSTLQRVDTSGACANEECILPLWSSEWQKKTACYFLLSGL